MLYANIEPFIIRSPGGPGGYYSPGGETVFLRHWNYKSEITVLAIASKLNRAINLKSSSVKVGEVANEVEGKVGVILNGGEGTNTMSKEGSKDC